MAVSKIDQFIHAPAWRRLLAFIIDLACFAFGLLAATYISACFFYDAGVDSGWYPLPMLAACNLLTLIFLILQLAFMIGQFGGTPGQLATRTFVIQNNRKDVNFQHGLARAAIMLFCFTAYSVVASISTHVMLNSDIYHSSDVISGGWKLWQAFFERCFIVWIGINAVFAFFNSRRRTLNDYLTLTAVVMRDQPQTFRESGAEFAS